VSILENIDLPLGKNTEYIDRYDPKLLCAIPRTLNREMWSSTEINGMLGWDRWYGFELSYIGAQGFPIQARLQLLIPSDSTNLVESKSLKLYLYSLRSTQFTSSTSLKRLIENDLSVCLGSELTVNIHEERQWQLADSLPGKNIDNIQVATEIYDPDPSLLKLEDDGEIGCYELNSNLFKSNCLVTGQPDWASLYIRYRGQMLDESSICKYLISYRNHQGFHEHCIEKIFFDILATQWVRELTVYGQYTRRGGLAIAPFRSNITNHIDFPLLWRT
jgi:7-cyano-7-deazaguanine reductase